MRRVPVVALLLVPVGAVAREYKLEPVLNQVTAGETFTVAADWIEPESDGFSVGLVLTNATVDRALALRKEDLACARGETPGQVEVVSGPMSLPPGASKTLTVTCVTGSGATGPYGVDVLRVYDDPERLGQPTDELLFERVRWDIAETAIQKKAQVVPPGFVPRIVPVDP